MPASRCRPTIRVCALVVRENRVLLVEQSKGDDRYWLLPGGAVERGESLHGAVGRELLEECGLHARPLRPPVGIVESISPDAGASRHVVHIIYAAEIRETETASPLDPSIRRVAFFSKSEMGALILHPPIQDALEEWVTLFGRGRPDPWPPFLDLGNRWV